MHTHAQKNAIMDVLPRRLTAILLLLAAAVFAAPSQAAVDLRIQATPITDPIQTFITVADVDGDPIGGLTAADFTVTLDGVVIPLTGFTFTLPPSQDPNQRVSVVFVMDFSSSVQSVALAAMQDAVISFINSMNVGDYAAIIKFNNTNPNRASVVQPFTEIDGGAGTSALIGAVMAPYQGSGTNLLDAVYLAVEQFNAPPLPLPSGPKAAIVITDGHDSASTTTESTAIAFANANSIPLFTVGVGDFEVQSSLRRLNSLADNTGGEFLPAPGDAEIAAAYELISLLLNNEYLLTLPPETITDCGQHTLQVAVTSQPTPASVTFARCDVIPEPFSFANQPSVARSVVVTSNTVTISGIDGPAPVSVTAGEYSVGCSNTFTSAAGTINNGQTVCVRHTTSSAYSTAQVTTLTIGGIAGTFRSVTRDEPPPRTGGGGGAMGLVELLAGLALLAAARRRWI